MVFSTDRQYTVRPPSSADPATAVQVTLDLAGSTFTVPVVGGPSVFATATGGDLEEAPVSGTVPATLSLSLGPAAAFGPFTPGVANDVHGEHHGERDLVGG